MNRPTFHVSLPILWAAGTCLMWAQTVAAPALEPSSRLDVVHERHHGPSQQLNKIRLVSWNIDHGSNLDNLVSALSHDESDLCLLQEVDWGTTRTKGQDVADVLADRLHLNSGYAVEFQELSQERGRLQAYIGQATLTRLPVLRSRILRFEHQSGFWKPHDWIPSSIPLFQRRTGGRVALITELKFGGRLLVVYNAHLESRSYGRIQNHQLDEILADLESHYPRDVAVILGGDLNTKYFPSWFLKKLEKLGFRSALGERIQRTHVIAFALDWIFVRGPLQMEAARVETGWHGSDHYPIRTELTSTAAEKTR